MIRHLLFLPTNIKKSISHRLLLISLNTYSIEYHTSNHCYLLYRVSQGMITARMVELTLTSSQEGTHASFPSSVFGNVTLVT